MARAYFQVLCSSLIYSHSLCAWLSLLQSSHPNRWRPLHVASQGSHSVHPLYRPHEGRDRPQAVPPPTADHLHSVPAGLKPVSASRSTAQRAVQCTDSCSTVLLSMCSVAWCSDCRSSQQMECLLSIHSPVCSLLRAIAKLGSVPSCFSSLPLSENHLQAMSLNSIIIHLLPRQNRAHACGPCHWPSGGPVAPRGRPPVRPAQLPPGCHVSS